MTRRSPDTFLQMSLPINGRYQLSGEWSPTSQADGGDHSEETSGLNILGIKNIPRAWILQARGFLYTKQINKLSV